MAQLFDFGLVGLGVMGRNFLLNVADHHFSAIGLDTDAQKVADLKDEGHSDDIEGTLDKVEFIKKLARPRKIMLLVPAGGPVDHVITDLLPLLDSGDLIIDGGNSHFEDTNRRFTSLKSKDIHFMGSGVSGGSEGARMGPSIMPGGDSKAYEIIKPIFEAVAAKVNNEPCVDFMGKGSAGNYVKMIHNGIEYVEMQLIASIYKLLIESNNYTNQNIAQIFEDWNNNLNSYLIDISTKKMLEKIDDEYLLEKIDDIADDNGTGRWMLNYGVELGCSLSMLSSALNTRFISKLKSERNELNKSIKQNSVEYKVDINSLKNAYKFCRLVNYIQAFCLINSANKNYNWQISILKALNVWSNGSIIKSSLINDLYSNYFVENILNDKKIIKDLNESKSDLINIITLSLKNDISIPCFNDALEYFNSISNNSLSTNMIQAQRNFFGSHSIKIK